MPVSDWGESGSVGDGAVGDELIEVDRAAVDVVACAEDAGELVVVGATPVLDWAWDHCIFACPLQAVSVTTAIAAADQTANDLPIDNRIPLRGSVLLPLERTTIPS